MPCHDTCLRQPSPCHLDSTSITSSPHATHWGCQSYVHGGAIHVTRWPLRATWSHEWLHHEHAITLGYTLDNSTLLTNNSHLQSFLMFCKLHSFPLDPTPDTLSFFIIFMCHHIKPHSVMQYLSGIINSLEPYFPNVRKHRQHTLVTQSLAGMTKLPSYSGTYCK